MTLTERKTNPKITAMFVETLTQPEMEKVSGGGYGAVVDFLWKKVKCEFGSHEMYDAGLEYQTMYFNLLCARTVRRCCWCNYEEVGEWHAVVQRKH